MSIFNSLHVGLQESIMCEGEREKSVPRITDWHHEACRVMTNGDREGQIFLSHPHTNNGFLFLAHHSVLRFILDKHEKGF